MPKTWEIQDPKTGRVFEIEGATMPSGAQLEAIFKSLPAGEPAAPATSSEPMWRQAMPTVAAAADFAQAAGAGLMSTGIHTGDVFRQLTGMKRIIDNPETQALMKYPDTLAGKAGFMAEQMAEFAVPAGAVLKATRGARMLPRMAAEAATGATIAGMQTADPTAAVVGGTLGALAPPVAAGVGRVARGARNVAGRAAAGAQEGGVGGAIAGAIRNVAPADPKVTIVQALKPRASLTNFPEALDRALPEIKAAETTLGRPIKNINDLLEATKAAKRGIQGQLDKLRGPQRALGAEVDLTPVAEAMTTSIPSKLHLQSPGAARRLVRGADVYRRAFTLDEAETLLRETNAELDGFYKLFPQGKQAALTSNPAAMQLDAQAKALRDTIYAKLDEPGQGAAARELNRRYGSLLKVEDVAFRRANVAARQQPESLAEQFGAIRAAGEIARGLYKIGRGSPVGGMADIVGGFAGRAAAKSIKESQTTDALIKRSFEAFKGAPVPVTMPPPVVVRGLLTGTRAPNAGRVPGSVQSPTRGTSPTPMQPGYAITDPPPDPSFVRGVPAQPAAHEVRGLLGRGETLPSSGQVRPMPGAVTPDPSGGGSVKAAPLAYDIDASVPVKPGGIRVKQFSSDPRAAKAAVANPDVQVMLKRMAADLETFTPSQGGIVGVGKGGHGFEEGQYVHGYAGSPVGDDLRVISEAHKSNHTFLRAIQQLIAGKFPTNRYHTAALDAAMGYLEKRPGYRGPSIPENYLDLPSTADDDAAFEAFSKAVDDLAD